MRAVRSAGSSSERLLAKILRDAGIRNFRLNDSHLPGKPDFFFKGPRLCIFIHGCFWHVCRKCKAHSIPVSNRSYWRAKFAKNVERDRKTAAKLRRMGYSVFTFWECELRKQPEKALKKIQHRLT